MTLEACCSQFVRLPKFLSVHLRFSNHIVVLFLARVGGFTSVLILLQSRISLPNDLLDLEFAGLLVRAHLEGLIMHRRRAQ